ncbi:Heterokaryon incompatibility protein 6,OR allele [Lachnellula subtilissima]|uniref:Heterokaryon incompatibility protein 6,OR allele n=1 Tax=Lachnellula subtilissima TaxID=602034 RepID=A0A8H8RFV8_9HELO|nr:Heterokaryon incompatibility protein 6,OR allele [Lachnellula subtilissima]
MAMEEPPAYKYEPISHVKEIRLLEIAPGPDDDPISCSLAHFSPENTVQEQYFALSYEWGPEDGPRRHIFLNGYTVSVRENLWRALWHLRKRAGWRDVTCESDMLHYGASAAWLCRSKIWIDALCVNQSDITERNHQVRLMAQIYRNAKEVLVWLGRLANLSLSESQEYRLSMLALDSYRKMVLFTREKVDGMNLRAHANPGANELSDLVWLVTQCASVHFLEILRALLEGSYWQRVWIIQEITLASKFALICDEFWIDPVILDIFLPFIEQEMDILEGYSSYCLKNDQFWTELYIRSMLMDPAKGLPKWPWQREELATWPWLREGDIHNTENVKEAITRLAKDVRDITRSKGFIINRHRQSRENTLGDLLWSCQGSLCSDPRDKIYGLLGLALDCQDEELVVDYSKSLFEVYKDVVYFYSKFYFVPDVVRFSQLLQRIFGSMYELDEAAGRHLRTSGALELIKTRGVILGTVSRLRKQPDLGREAGSTSTDAANSSSEFLDLMERVLTITANASKAFHREVSFDIFDTKEQREAAAQIDTGCKTQENSGFLNFKLETGRAGIISANARKGDVVCQFLGCDICAVLRRSADSPTYSVVGRAMIQKSRLESQLEENSTWDELKWREKSHCVFDLDRDYKWPLDKTIDLELDIVTLQQLTR